MWTQASPPLILRRNRFEIRVILPAEAVEAATPRFKKPDDLVDLVQRANPKAGIVTPARMGPAGVSLFMAGTQDDDFGLPFRSACRAPGNRSGKAHFMDAHREAPPRGYGCRVRQPG